MARAQSSQTHRRHKKILKLAKGYRASGSRCYRTAIERVEKALQYAYRDRRNKKRSFRALWIQRINAAARINGLTYSQLMNGLKKANIEMDRKVLADIAVHDADAFAEIAKAAQKALGEKAEKKTASKPAAKAA